MYLMKKHILLFIAILVIVQQLKMYLMKKHILLFIAILACITGYSQSTKIIGSTPVQYVTSNRSATKPDLVLYATNNTQADLSALGDSLGGRNMVTLIITKPTGVSVNPSFPAITDTLLGTKIKVKVYLENTSEQIGVFQADLGFVIGFDGTVYTDNSTVLFIQDLEEYVFWPVEDVNGLHWAYTKTSDSSDGNGIYSGSDSLRQTNTYAAMAADGSQSFGIGNLPSFPSMDYSSNEHGLLIAKNTGEYAVSLINGKSYVYISNNLNLTAKEAADLRLTASSKNAYLQSRRTNGTSRQLGQDSISAYVQYGQDPSIMYRFPDPNVSKPSTTSGVVNILKWTAGVPSFSVIPNIYTENGTISTERTISLGGSNGDYFEIDGASNNKQLDMYFSSDGQYNNDSYFRFRTSKTNQTNNFGNFNWSHYVYGPSDKTYSIGLNASATRSSSNNTGAFYDMDLRRASGTFVVNHLMQIDSSSRLYNYLVYKSDSNSIGGKKHILGFAYKTITVGSGNVIAPTKSFLLQTNFFNSSTKFDWLRVDNLDTDTTSNRITFYNNKYAFPNAAPSNTSGVVSILNWLGTGSAATPRMTRIGDAITGTARIVPYMNSSGRFVTGNTYFKIDTNTTSGAQARIRLLINNPNGDLGEGDSYSVLSVRAGDALGAEAITNFGDQALTQGTTGYGAVMQVSRSGGNFTTKTNLANGNEVGKFAWRGYVNGGSRALGHIQLNYVGDGTTYNSDLIGASAVSGSVVSGWKLDNQSRFWLGSGADDYHFPTTGPSNTTSDKNILIWTGTGSTPATPSFGTITGLMVDGQFTTGTPSLTAFGTGTAQRYVAVVELTSGASANTDIPLPTANVGTFGKSILISPRDLNTTYNINATGSIELNGASTASVILTKPTEFVCNVVSVGPTTYRWVMVDNATSSGSSSASTDGSGDVVITHNKNHTSYVVDIQGTGTTLGIGYTVTAKTATTFTVRAYDTSTKAAIASTGVTFDWIIKE